MLPFLSVGQLWPISFRTDTCMTSLMSHLFHSLLVSCDFCQGRLCHISCMHGIQSSLTVTIQPPLFSILHLYYFQRPVVSVEDHFSLCLLLYTPTRLVYYFQPYFLIFSRNFLVKNMSFILANLASNTPFLGYLSSTYLICQSMHIHPSP